MPRTAFAISPATYGTSVRDGDRIGSPLAQRSASCRSFREARLGVPVANVGKFIAIGLNYADHAAESNLPIPKEPVVFTKATSSLTGPNDQVAAAGLRQER